MRKSLKKTFIWHIIAFEGMEDKSRKRSGYRIAVTRNHGQSSLWNYKVGLWKLSRFLLNAKNNEIGCHRNDWKVKIVHRKKKEYKVVISDQG